MFSLQIEIERSNSNKKEKLTSDQKDGMQFVNDTRISQHKDIQRKVQSEVQIIDFGPNKVQSDSNSEP